MHAPAPRRGWLFFKVALFLLVAPGSVVVYIPALLVVRGDATSLPQPFSLRSAFSVLLALAGALVVVDCVKDFALHGKGTPAPVDPPAVLVVRGLYRFTRNPMYHGVLALILAEALFLMSPALLVYALAVLCLFHLFIVVFEEKDLRARFGNAYEHYLRAVPRWGMTFRPYRGFRDEGP